MNDEKQTLAKQSTVESFHHPAPKRMRGREQKEVAGDISFGSP